MGAYDWCFYELENIPAEEGSLYSSMQAIYRGELSTPGAQINLPYRACVKPGFLDPEPHFHRDEEYLAFVGYDIRDPFESFDAEIVLWIGENRDEMEPIVITAPSMVRIPKFYWHGPIEVRSLGKPLFFQPILYSERFYAIRQRREENGAIYYKTYCDERSPYDMFEEAESFTGGLGASTGKYSHLVYTFEKQYTHWGDFMPPYQAYFRGHDCMPDSDIYTSTAAI